MFEGLFLFYDAYTGPPKLTYHTHPECSFPNIQLPCTLSPKERWGTVEECRLDMAILNAEIRALVESKLLGVDYNIRCFSKAQDI